VSNIETTINTDDNNLFGEVWDPLQDPIKYVPL
jgi:hypothetical protein